MNYNLLVDLSFVGLSFLLIVATAVLVSYSHEEVHQMAYANVGVNSVTGFELFPPRMFTLADNNQWQNLTIEDKRLIKLENSINESVSYNTGPYFVALLSVLVLGFFYLKNNVSQSEKFK